LTWSHNLGNHLDALPLDDVDGESECGQYGEADRQRQPSLFADIKALMSINT